MPDMFRFLGLLSSCHGTIDGISSVWRIQRKQLYSMSGHIDGSDNHHDRSVMIIIRLWDMLAPLRCVNPSSMANAEFPTSPIPSSLCAAD